LSKVVAPKRSGGGAKMSGAVPRLIAGCVLALAIAAPAVCEDLVGTVAGSGGQAVQGVRIIATSRDGQITEAATTDANGQYIIPGLDPGQYMITLDPAGAGVQGQTVASYLGNSGLTVNWSVAPGLSPLASAKPGTELGSSAAGHTSKVLASSDDPPPGCKGMPGPPCGPKKSKKRHDD
jgi:hypothetical protein